MTKKEMWDKLNKIKYDKHAYCDVCIENKKLAYLENDNGDTFYICEECFVGKENELENKFMQLVSFPHTRLEELGEELNKVFIENKEPMNTSKEYIKKICDSAYEEDKEAIDEAIKYLGGK